MKFTRPKVLIAYTIGNIRDELLCDILPMVHIIYYLGGHGSLTKVSLIIGQPTPTLLRSKAIATVKMLRLAIWRETQVRRPYS